jgi:hypothetical protein
MLTPERHAIRTKVKTINTDPLFILTPPQIKYRLTFALSSAYRPETGPLYRLPVTTGNDRESTITDTLPSNSLPFGKTYKHISGACQEFFLPDGKFFLTCTGMWHKLHSHE